jgi:hypothetical protein
MKHIPVMMGIASPTGSHLPALVAALDSLPAGALVIEHGAGLYSTPLLAQRDIEVQCIETHAGWLEWAAWVYRLSSRPCEMVDSWKHADVGRAALVFVDGAARDRGPLVKLALEKGASLIVAHDTEEEHWSEYRHQRHYFEAPGYKVTHDNEPHRTTVWSRL